MVYRVAIVEDDPEDARQLDGFLTRFGEENDAAIHSAIFHRPGPFLERPCGAFDLVLMDIELPELNGIEAARKLRAHDPYVTLIFVTNMAQYAIHGYEVGALDYVLKPVSYPAFAMKLKKAVKTIQKFQDTDVPLVIPGGLVCLRASQILYVEVAKHYLTYHAEGGSYTVRESMKEAQAKLEPFHFLRCNNCYLVNLRHVTAVEGNTAVVGGVPLQISRPRRGEFLKGLANYLGGNI